MTSWQRRAKLRYQPRASTLFYRMQVGSCPVRTGEEQAAPGTLQAITQVKASTTSLPPPQSDLPQEFIKAKTDPRSKTGMAFSRHQKQESHGAQFHRKRASRHSQSKTWSSSPNRRPRSQVLNIEAQWRAPDQSLFGTNLVLEAGTYTVNSPDAG